MKLLIIDNYDSFTWNLVEIFRSIEDVDIHVRKNDEVTVAEAGGFDKILLSPGPGLPDEAGITMNLIDSLGPSKSILGICLGHQAIALIYGAVLFRLDRVNHGECVTIKLTGDDHALFNGLYPAFEAGLYHSWAVSAADFPACLAVTAISPQGLIMALKHRIFDVHGVQFHPESIMTPAGARIIENWAKTMKQP